MTAGLADRLLEAVMPARVHTAVVVRAGYQPVGGAGRTVMPPTYPVGQRRARPECQVPDRTAVWSTASGGTPW